MISCIELAKKRQRMLKKRKSNLIPYGFDMITFKLIIYKELSLYFFLWERLMLRNMYVLDIYSMTDIDILYSKYKRSNIHLQFGIHELPVESHREYTRESSM